MYTAQKDYVIGVAFGCAALTIAWVLWTISPKYERFLKRLPGFYNRAWATGLNAVGGVGVIGVSLYYWLQETPWVGMTIGVLFLAIAWSSWTRPSWCERTISRIPGFHSRRVATGLSAAASGLLIGLSLHYWVT